MDPHLPKRKVVDCFTFYNELQLLNYRLHLLDPVVDYFVLAEATHTHSGKEKELYYEKYKNVFADFHHKIIHVVVDDFPHIYPNIDYGKNEQWINENFQRNMLTRGINQLPLSDTDLIMVSDLDEIPDPRVVREIRKIDNNVDRLQFVMDLYYYNIHCRHPEIWMKSKMISNVYYRQYMSNGTSLTDVRMNGSYPSIKCGWHLSYFGDKDFIHNKLVHFAHQELNIESITNVENIHRRMISGNNLFDGRQFRYIPLENNDYLPLDFDKYLVGFYTLSSAL